MAGAEGAWGLRIAAAVAVAFGLLTIKKGGTVLFICSFMSILPVQ